MLFHFKGPHILKNPRTFKNDHIRFNARLNSPWVLLVRICSLSAPLPTQVNNVRIRIISRTKVIILWDEDNYPGMNR